MPPTSPKNDSPWRTASARLKGLAVSKIEKLPPDYWVFRFGNGVALSTQSQWRLLSQNAILLTSEDDGHQYGLPEPVDAVARIRELLESRVVSKAEVDQAFADYGTLEIDGEASENIIPIPLDRKGNIQLTLKPSFIDDPIVVRGNHVRLELQGAPIYVEKFSGSTKA